MNTTNPKVDIILAEGCGRCELVGTPQCKMNLWRTQLKKLRHIILDCGLIEEVKWGQPTYTYNNSNIVLIHSFREYCAIMFFKGVLLHDAEGILVQQTENVQGTRQVRFTKLEQITKLERTLKAYIFEAIEVEKAGLKVKYKETAEFKMPDELKNKFIKNAAFKKAFNELTPGRQRGYILHFAQAKQSKTREERIEKCTPLIMKGKGLHDDYSSKRKK